MYRAWDKWQKSCKIFCKEYFATVSGPGWGARLHPLPPPPSQKLGVTINALDNLHHIRPITLTCIFKKIVLSDEWLETCWNQPFLNANEVAVCVLATFLPKADVF